MPNCRTQSRAIAPMVLGSGDHRARSARTRFLASLIAIALGWPWNNGLGQSPHYRAEVSLTIPSEGEGYILVRPVAIAV
jgi:hypothetical protein